MYIHVHVCTCVYAAVHATMYMYQYPSCSSSSGSTFGSIRGGMQVVVQSENHKTTLKQVHTLCVCVYVRELVYVCAMCMCEREHESYGLPLLPSDSYYSGDPHCSGLGEGEVHTARLSPARPRVSGRQDSYPCSGK